MRSASTTVAAVAVAFFLHHAAIVTSAPTTSAPVTVAPVTTGAPPVSNIGCPISPTATGRVPFTQPSGFFALPAWDLPSNTPVDASNNWVLNCTWLVQCPMGTIFSVSNMSMPTFLGWTGGVSFINVDTKAAYGTVIGQTVSDRGLLFNSTNVLVSLGTDKMTGEGFSVSYQCLPVRCTTNKTAGTVNCTSTLSCPIEKRNLVSILQLRVGGRLGLQYEYYGNPFSGSTKGNGLENKNSVTASFISNLVGVGDLMFQYSCAQSKCGSPNISGSVFTQSTGSIMTAAPVGWNANAEVCKWTIDCGVGRSVTINDLYMNTPIGFLTFSNASGVISSLQNGYFPSTYIVAEGRVEVSYSQAPWRFSYGGGANFSWFCGSPLSRNNSSSVKGQNAASDSADAAANRSIIIGVGAGAGFVILLLGVAVAVLGWTLRRRALTGENSSAIRTLATELIKTNYDTEPPR